MLIQTDFLKTLTNADFVNKNLLEMNIKLKRVPKKPVWFWESKVHNWA